MYRRFFKRFIDLVGVFTGMVLTSPVWVTVIPLLTVANRGKVFFFQERPGKDGKIFRLIKFRTMNDSRDLNGCLLPDNQRITRAGRWIRAMSFDELPQLWNVLKGEMSLIGPRPLLPEYLPLYSPRQMRRHEVRPGITGWAQCHGRNNLNWNDRFELDVWYVDNIRFVTDWKIFFSTAKNVFTRKGVTPNGREQMEPFNGNN